MTENSEQNPNTEDLITRQNKAKKAKKKKKFGWLYLFVFVFILALVSVSYLVKYYSPDVDVAIGNSEDLTLNSADIEYEIRPIDERLKWIQMEDEMPSVSIKKEKAKSYDYLFGEQNSKGEISKAKKEIESKKEKQPPKVKIEDVKQKTAKSEPLALNDSILSHKKTAPAAVEPSVTITKVYLGSYASLDEAIEAQHKVSASGLAVSPFVKAVKDKYIVQVGSFYDSQKADDLVSSMKAKGFSAKKKVEK